MGDILFIKMQIVFFLTALLDIPTIFTIVAVCKVRSFIKVVLLALIFAVLGELIVTLTNPATNHQLFLYRIVAQEYVAVAGYFSVRYGAWIQRRRLKNKQENLTC